MDKRGGIDKDNAPRTEEGGCSAVTWGVIALLVNIPIFLYCWGLPYLLWQRHADLATVKWLYPLACYVFRKFGGMLAPSCLALFELPVYVLVFGYYGIRTPVVKNNVASAWIVGGGIAVLHIIFVLMIP